jgi:hypothetical protein
VFTTFIDNFVFEVKVHKGTKHDQNAGHKFWFGYTQEGLASKDEVVTVAISHAILRLAKEGEKIVTELINEDDIPEVCSHCGHTAPDHHASCTPYYPENPDLSDEVRVAHGLPTKADMEYWENVPEVSCIETEPVKIKMIDATPRRDRKEVSERVLKLNKDFNF